MNLADVKKMLAKGTQWDAVNSYNPRTNGPRTILATFATQFQWKAENGMGGFSYWPRKYQIIEVRDGFLCFQIHNAKDCNPVQNNWSVDDTLTLTRIEAPAAV
jgi:hypothetical protein